MKSAPAILSAAFFLIFLVSCGRPAASKKVLRLYAGAGLRRGVDAVIEAFTRETDIRVEPDYGGSGMIISRAREDRDADLFMPGDVWYVDRLNEKAGLVESKTDIAYFVPVIITSKGNPKQINGLNDFFREDVKPAVGNPDACQIGRLTGRIFDKAGLDISKLSAKKSLTVNELGVWVKMHDADAAIIWDAIAANISDSVDVVPIPERENIVSRVVIALMKTSGDKDSAGKFIDFIAHGKGRRILKHYGYRTTPPYSEGD